LIPHNNLIQELTTSSWWYAAAMPTACENETALVFMHSFEGVMGVLAAD
jgi:hypothetical protein